MKSEELGQLSFEQSLAQLEQVVRQLETGDVSLSVAMELFEKGVALSRHCGIKLDEASAKIQILLEKNGEITKEPFTSGD